MNTILELKELVTKKGQLEYLATLLGALIQTRIQLECDYRAASSVNLTGKATAESVGKTSEMLKQISHIEIRIKQLRVVSEDIENGKLQI